MRYLILGAGPAGLAFANRLLEKGINDFLVLEANKTAGGLCRSDDVDGTALDIGGGHFLDVRRKRVNDFLFRFMPENEWNLFDRDSQICVQGQHIHHPFEANIWEFGIDEQIEYLKSIAKAGCNAGEKEPSTFVQWITWKLGDRIAEDYMLPYNQKMFGNDLNLLGTYWLEKLPDVSFEDTLRSCLMRKPYAKQPGHAQFYYPKEYGYGELWLRMANALGDKILYEKSVCHLNYGTHMVTIDNGDTFIADKIITTIPWVGLQSLSGCPDSIAKSVKKLKHTSVRVDYYPDHIDTKAHWIYYPDLELNYHRILVRHNFCANSIGYWTETNGARALKVEHPMFSHMNEYAYPLNTIEKPQIMERLLRWSENKGVYGLGRWGEHQHYNSDVAVEKAMDLADKLEPKE